MNRKLAFTLLVSLLLACFATGCGDTNKLLSIEDAAALSNGGQGHNIFGIGGTVALKIVAVYSNSKQVDITDRSTYTSSDSTILTVDSAGVVTAVAGYCTYLAGSGGPPFLYNPTGPLTITATFQGMTVAMPFGVNTVANCNGPTTSAQNHEHHRRQSLDHFTFGTILAH